VPQSLKTKVVLISTVMIVASLGISGVLARKQAASFFAEHESRIEQGGHHEAVIGELRQERYSLLKDLAAMRLLTAGVAVCALSTTLAIGWRRRVSRPMALMSDRIRKMRLGTWSQPIPIEQDDEIGTLLREFNELGPNLSLTAHQYAAASKLAAMALIGQRVVRRAMSARQRLLAVSETLARRPGDGQFHEIAVEQLRLVAAELEAVAVDFESEFQAELARVGAGRRQVA
jgi:methyl-accepting chemotaxis protein